MSNKTTYQQTYRQTEQGGIKFKTYQKEYRKKRAEQETQEERENRLEYQRLYRLKKKAELEQLPQEQQDLIIGQKKRYKRNWNIKKKFNDILKQLQEDEQEVEFLNLLEQQIKSEKKN